MCATTILSLGTALLLAGKGSAKSVSLQSSWAQVYSNTGNTWVCGHPALVKWNVADGTPDDTAVTVYLTGAADDQLLRMDKRVFAAGDRQVYITLDCGEMGLGSAPMTARVAIAKGMDKPTVVATTEPFSIATFGVISPSAGTILAPGVPFTLKWATPGHDGNIEAYLYGSPAKGSPVLLATLASALPDTGSAEITVPAEVKGTYDNVFVRLLSSGQYVDSPNYAFVPAAQQGMSWRRVARQVATTMATTTATTTATTSARKSTVFQGFQAIKNMLKRDRSLQFNQISGGLEEAVNVVGEGVGSAIESLTSLKPVTAVTEITLGFFGGVKNLLTTAISGAMQTVNMASKTFSMAVGTVMAGTEATRQSLTNNYTS